MSLHHLLGSIIRSEFLSVVGKFQATKATREAMLLRFGVPTKDGEEGFRDVEMLIYGHQNYVGVYTRETWNVIPEGDLLDDDRGPKPGKKYDKGEGPWKLESYHDSGWSDAIESFLKSRLLLSWGFAPGSKWYRIVDAGGFELPEKR
jgi:hypothetical protein